MYLGFARQLILREVVAIEHAGGDDVVVLHDDDLCVAVAGIGHGVMPLE